MINYPKVSIVTPSYNQKQFLEETILSVLNQDYPNIEYIIIDGGSTDGSVDIIRKYEHQLSYWVSEPDRGQSQAINKGFQRAKGDILAWLNSDDEYTQGAILTAVQTFIKYPDVAMVYGNCDIIDEQGNLTGHIRSHQCDLKSLFRGNNIPQPSTFFKKKVLEEIGPLNETLKYAMDYDLFLRISSKFKIKYLPSTLSRFRYQNQSKTISEGIFFWQEVFFVLDNFLLNMLLPRTFSDEACSHMIKLILQCKEDQKEMAIKCIKHINNYGTLDTEDIQNIFIFSYNNNFNKVDFKKFKKSLFQIYRAFHIRYKLNDINNVKNKYGYKWVNKQIVYQSHNLFNKGERAGSKRILWILLITNPDMLIDLLTLKLVIKYLITKRIQ